MRVQLSDNRVARVSVCFGNDTPALEKPLPPAAIGKQFRSIRIEVKVYDNQEMAGPVVADMVGESFCSPLDQFQRFKGRKIAMKRLMSIHRQVLSKEDWQTLCPVMLRGPVGLVK